MRATDLLGQLGRTVAYYPNMVKHFKSVTATVLFCQLFYWHDKAHSELGIYKTTEEITEETGLSYKEQLTARKHLIALNVLIETPKRLEHKIYYKINLDRVNELLESPLENSPPSQKETGGITKSNLRESQNGSSLISKITTEINTSDKSLYEQSKRRNEFFDDMLNFLASEFERLDMDADESAKSAEEVALKLHENWQSHALVFPKSSQLVMEKRKRAALADFNGHNITDIIRNHRVSETTFHRWMREERTELKKQIDKQQGKFDF